MKRKTHDKRMDLLRDAKQTEIKNIEIAHTLFSKELPGGQFVVKENFKDKKLANSELLHQLTGMNGKTVTVTIVLKNGITMIAEKA